MWTGFTKYLLNMYKWIENKLDHSGQPPLIDLWESCREGKEYLQYLIIFIRKTWPMQIFFFPLYSKQLHFLLKYPGALLSCWSVLKAAISVRQIHYPDTYALCRWSWIQQNQGETTREDQAHQLLHAGTTLLSETT